MTNVTLSNLPPTTAEGSVVMDLVRSEWAKFRTVRSTYWSLVAAVIAMIGLGALISATQSGHQFSFDPVSISLSGVILAQLAIGVLGALFVTSEYSTGMIRTTFSAAPQRRSVIATKAAVFAVAALGPRNTWRASSPSSSAKSASSLTTGSASPRRARYDQSFGVGLYLGLLAVFAVGLAATIRRSYRGSHRRDLFGIILVLPAVAQALPSSIQDSVDKYLPSNAGQAIFHTIQRHLDTRTVGRIECLCAVRRRRPSSRTDHGWASRCVTRTDADRAVTLGRRDRFFAAVSRRRIDR
jgi:ABC-2 type transport system permease protein